MLRPVGVGVVPATLVTAVNSSQDLICLALCHLRTQVCSHSAAVDALPRHAACLACSLSSAAEAAAVAHFGDVASWGVGAWSQSKALPMSGSDLPPGGHCSSNQSSVRSRPSSSNR